MNDENRPPSDGAEPTSDSATPEMSRRGVLAGTAGIGLINEYDPSDAPNNVAAEQSNAPIDVGLRLELFVDDYLVESMDGVEQQLHSPEFQDVSIVHDEPWEGGFSLYHTVFEDDGRYRMYYRGGAFGVGTSDASHRDVACYAESEDGIEWEKPNLGLHEFEGSTDNNIVLDDGLGTHNFTPFKDDNPDTAPDATYKAVGGTGELYAYKSPDGIHWERLSDDPILTGEGAFDSQNLAFWDSVEGEYRAYYRDFRDGRRIVEVVRSDDFVEWTHETALEYPDAPKEQLYVNGIKPYYRAPHIYLGFPARYVERDYSTESMAELPGWELRQELSDLSLRYGAATSDTLFMSSRDGETFNRWPYAYVEPGLWEDDSNANWFYADQFMAWQLLETESTTPGKPAELSMFLDEGYWTDATRLRRYTSRIDGFVSMQVPLEGGEFVTRPVTFDGDELVVNYSTSAAGSIRIELQNPGGQPYQGFSLAESPELFGDDLTRSVEWSGGASVADLKNRPVRLRFVMEDADLYSFQFPERDASGSDLVAHYPLDTIRDDGTVPDASSNGYDGTNNGATVADGNVDDALAFGGDDYVDVADLGGEGSLTVATWVTGANDAIEYLFDGGGHTYALYYHDTGEPTWWIDTQDGPTYFRGPDLSDRDWVHLAGTYDGSTMRLYVDGQEVNSLGVTSSDLVTSGHSRIAEGTVNTGYAFDGRIDDLHVYDRALSSTEIASLVDRADGST